MPDIVVYRAGSHWATPWEEAFIEGLRAHGIEPEQRPQNDRRVSDIAVIWAHRQRPLFEMQREAGCDYIILERGHLPDRHYWTSVGYNGLNGRADFRNANSPGDRWERHFAHLMQPWRSVDGYDLVLGQVPGDASIRGRDYPGWLQHVAKVGTDVRWRPHPLVADMPTPAGMKRCTAASLHEALDGARRAITFNSNAGVDAVLYGVPTIAWDEGSMAWPVSAHEMTDPPQPDRTQWAHDLAYANWSMDEIRSGECWEHLKPA